MNDKIVNIKKENKLDYYINHLNDNIDLFKNVDGVEGLTLNGGLARGYGDHLSEVDITIYLSEESYLDFTKGLLKLKEGICKINKVVYDIKIVSYKKEFERKWSPIVELWDLSYAKILYDPKKLIEKLIKNKLASKSIIDSIQRSMFDAWWHYKLAGDIWIYREDAIQGHFMLNDAAKGILKSIYIANNEYVPHDKWIINLIGNLKWLPIEKEKLLEQLFATGDMTLKSLKERQKNINTIWKKINDFVIEKYYDNLQVDVTKKYCFDRLVELLKYDFLPIYEFEKIFGLRCLSSDPFAEIVHIKDDKVYIDKEKFKLLDIDSMYSWHYDIVKATQILEERNSK